MRFSLFWDVTQRRLVVSYRRFGTTYRFTFHFLLLLFFSFFLSPSPPFPISLPFLHLFSALSPGSGFMLQSHFPSSDLDRHSALTHSCPRPLQLYVPFPCPPSDCILIFSCCSTYSLFDGTALFPSALVHPNPVGLACLLCSSFLYFLLFSFFAFCLLYVYIFLSSFFSFFLYFPPSCTWWWLQVLGLLSLRAPLRQFNLLPLLPPPPRSTNPID